MKWVSVIIAIASLGIALTSLNLAQSRTEPKLQVSGLSFIKYVWTPVPGAPETYSPDIEPPTETLYYGLAVVSNPSSVNIELSDFMPDAFWGGFNATITGRVGLDHCWDIGPEVLEPGHSMAVLLLLPERALPEYFFAVDVLGQAYYMRPPTDDTENFAASRAYIAQATDIMHKCGVGELVPLEAAAGSFELE